jgi:hypothetical protein
MIGIEFLESTLVWIWLISDNLGLIFPISLNADQAENGLKQRF